MHINLNKFLLENQSLNLEINLSSLSRVNDLEPQFNGLINIKINSNCIEKNRYSILLTIYGKISALCQKCLQPIQLSLDNELEIAVFNTEDELNTAINLDHENCDGIVVSKNFDIINLIEDELIMLLPIAPKHDLC